MAEQSKELLLIIGVADIDSVPVVRYKGQEISNKVSVLYGWTTRTDVEGKHELTINFWDEDEPDIQTIRERREESKDEANGNKN